MKWNSDGEGFEIKVLPEKKWGHRYLLGEELEIYLQALRDNGAVPLL